MNALMDTLISMDITVLELHDVSTLWVVLCASVLLGTNSLIEVVLLHPVKVRFVVCHVLLYIVLSHFTP